MRSLPQTTKQELYQPDAPTHREGAGSFEEVIRRLEARIGVLEAALKGAEDRFTQLHHQYVKISDMWNAFQAAHNLEPRDIIRAEAVGEFARQLSMLLIRAGMKP